MAMAFSVDQLKKENLLIKNLDALETSGQVVDILTGKTATLTTGDMEVSRIHVIDQTFEIDSLQANMEVLNTLYDCIILNCDAHM
jgi:magnesium-transporting ATPase (P-type)